MQAAEATEEAGGAGVRGLSPVQDRMQRGPAVLAVLEIRAGVQGKLGTRGWYDG